MDNKYMMFAYDLAKQNLLTNNGGPFGAIIVKGDTIVGVGNNHVLADKDPTAHGEIVAIRNACKNLNTHDLSDCELYTSCYPCPMCLSAIIWSNIKKVYYGNTKQDAADIGFRDDFIYEYLKNMDENVLSLVPMEKDNTIFQQYKNKRDKQLY